QARLLQTPTRRRRVTHSRQAPGVPSPGLATASLSHAELWRVVMRPYLRSALWSARDAYDAGTHLPVAIRAAFRRGHSPWQRDLGELYADFVDARRAGKPDTPAMHYMAFLATAAQFMAEARRSDAWRSVPDDLLATVTADVIDEWESVVSRSIATK